MLEETWIKENNPQTDREAIKKDLVTNLTRPNSQFENPFHHFGEILGYSVHSELEIKDNYTDSNSPYQTRIDITSYFTLPENVPPKTKLTIPKQIIDFLEKEEFRRPN